VTPFRDRAQQLLFLFLTIGIVLVPARAGAASFGTIEGRVIRAPSDAPLPHVKVTLLGADRDGSNPVTRVAVTDSHGSYTFDHVPASNGRIYAVNAIYDGGLFAGGAIQVPANTTVRPVIQTRLRVWKTTTDPAAILITRDDLFVQQNHDGAGVIESITVQNNTDAAYIGRGGSSGQRKGPVPSLGFALPSGAARGGVAIVDSDIDLPQLLRTDFGVAATTAIPPGVTGITYSYQVQGLVGSTDISRTTLYPTVEFSIFAAPPLAIQSNRLARAEGVTLGKIKYQRWSSKDPLAPGDELQAVTIAKAGLAPGLIIGIIAGIVVFVLVGLMVFLRSRRAGRRTDRVAPASRQELLVAIAKLDRDHDSGDVREDEWRRERARLKSQVERFS
jgi:uncharacterized membrane protein